MKSTLVALGFLSVAALAVPDSCRAATYYVNGTTGNDSYDGLAAAWNGTHGPKKAIVAGVNAAASDDTVSIAAGVYSGTSNIAVAVAKPLVIQSESGSDATTVDCNQQGRALNISSSPTTVNGIKFANGFVDYGAVNIEGTTTGLVQVLNCSFVSNGFSAVYSAGIPTIVSNCYFTANTKTSGDTNGAAIYGLYYFTDPFSPIVVGSLTVKNCSFINNATGPSGRGGAICAVTLPVDISDCSFASNSASIGGALQLSEVDSPSGNGSDVQISNCAFLYNVASRAAGAIICSSSHHLAIRGCLFASNSATTNAAAISLGGGTIEMLNCTFTKNQAAVQSVIRSSLGATGSITNSVIWDNPSGDGVPISFGGSISCSDVQGGWTGAGTNNINADPLFVDSANGDYHLKSEGGHWTTNGWVTDSVTSPCVDAGDPASDYFNEPMPNGGRVNIGYYGNTPQASKSPPPQITSIVLTNLTDLLLAWKTTGSSNVVLIQVCPGDASGGYSTSGFTDLTNLVVTTATTNFWDVGAATNGPSRYYRMRLVP